MGMQVVKIQIWGYCGTLGSLKIWSSWNWTQWWLLVILLTSLSLNITIQPRWGKNILLWKGIQSDGNKSLSVRHFVSLTIKSKAQPSTLSFWIWKTIPKVGGKTPIENTAPHTCSCHAYVRCMAFILCNRLVWATLSTDLILNYLKKCDACKRFESSLLMRGRQILQTKWPNIQSSFSTSYMHLYE